MVERTLQTLAVFLMDSVCASDEGSVAAAGEDTPTSQASEPGSTSAAETPATSTLLAPTLASTPAAEATSARITPRPHTGLSVAVAIEVTIPQPVYEFARGDNITLPCTFTTNSPHRNYGIVTWSVVGEDKAEFTILAYYGFSNILDIKKIYEGRVKLEHDLAKGNANLKLNSITLADNKQFECKVQIPADDEGTLATTTRLVVLAPPSPPICKIEGKAEYGQDIKLTCLSEEGSPTPTYRWQSHNVNNVARPNPPKATDRNGVLSLFNITAETSGYYICTSINKIRSAKCNITLSVMPPKIETPFSGCLGDRPLSLQSRMLFLVSMICCALACEPH